MLRTTISGACFLFAASAAFAQASTTSQPTALLTGISTAPSTTDTGRTAPADLGGHSTSGGILNAEGGSSASGDSGASGSSGAGTGSDGTSGTSNDGGSTGTSGTSGSSSSSSDSSGTSGTSDGASCDGTSGSSEGSESVGTSGSSDGTGSAGTSGSSGSGSDDSSASAGGSGGKNMTGGSSGSGSSGNSGGSGAGTGSAGTSGSSGSGSAGTSGTSGSSSNNEDCIVSYCFGEGCPCDNDDPSAGCANGTGSGALLTASGSTSVAADELVLCVTNGVGQRFSFLCYGMAPDLIPFRDGLLCINQPLRLGVQQFSNGEVCYGPGLVAESCAADAAGLACIDPGETWYFQVAYRDMTGPCQLVVNFTNALRVTFTN